MAKVLPLSEIKNLVGQEIGKSEWLLIDQERVNRFAECTEDRQWIHTDPERAAAGPFGTTIVHGFLTLSLIPHFGSEAGVVPEGTKMTINYGLDRVRLLNPVPVGSKIRDVMVMKDLVEKGPGRILVSMTHTIEIEGQDKPACIAEILLMHVMESG